MSDRVGRVECFIFEAERDQPYLGSLRAGEDANRQGYFVRAGNRTVYPTFDRSVVVRLTSADGAEGWGETYGIVAPGAVTAIINDLLAEFVIGRDPMDAATIHEDLYDLMRVRGYDGGFYLDALAAIDIALWDLAGQLASLPVAKLLGGRRRDRVKAYVSGLPKPTLEERVAFAQERIGRGFDAVKFAAVVADDGAVRELAALREGLGPDIAIAVDLHWQLDAPGAVSLASAMQPYRPWFIEAPVKPEDLDGQAWIAERISVPLALGEEWRTVFQALTRLKRNAVGIIQPEMGHTGITQFMRIGQCAQAHHVRIIPHATIGMGIFMAASLQASSALYDVPAHEFQHSIFEKNRRFLETDMACENGAYVVPQSPGLGVRPDLGALRPVAH
ncbi:MAG: mandelate racemase/muconate lactonizing enzyme family protein [Pseudomonadota bacterium]